MDMIVVLHWHLGIWVWEHCNSRCQYLALSLLGGCFVPWLQLLPLFFGRYCGCVLPGWESSGIMPLGFVGKMCFRYR